MNTCSLVLIAKRGEKRAIKMAVLEKNSGNSFGGLGAGGWGLGAGGWGWGLGAGGWGLEKRLMRLNGRERLIGLKGRA